MQRLPKEIGETKILVHFLTGRYGALALTRAAGEADSARRRGDEDSSALWQSVIADLRQTVSIISAEV